MSASTPILIVSPVCAWAVAASSSAKQNPRATRRIVPSRFQLFLYPKVGVQLVEMRRQIGVDDHVDDAAMLDDVMPVGNRRGKPEILLDQKDGEPFGLQRADDGADLLHDDRRQTLGRLVEQQEAG